MPIRTPAESHDEASANSVADNRGSKSTPDASSDPARGASEVEALLQPPSAARESADGTLWTLEQLDAFLRNEHLADGSPLESRFLAGSLDGEVQRQTAAYEDGLLGFALRRESIRFPMTPAKAVALRDAIASGEINGCVVEAYPTEEEVKAMAAELKSSTPTELLDQTAVTFLAMHFQARRGRIAHADTDLARWVHFSYSDTKPLWQVFAETSEALGVAPEEWVEPAGEYAPGIPRMEYTDAFIKVFATVRQALAIPPTLRQRLGTARLVFTKVTARLAPKKEKWDTTKGYPRLPRPDAPPAKRDPLPNGPTLIELLQQHADFLTTAEALALVASVSDPTNVDSYPSASLSSAEWCAAIGEGPGGHTASGALLEASGGLQLTSLTASESSIDVYARPAVR
jgi:hypothetical protein